MDKELDDLIVDFSTEEFQGIIKGQYEQHKEDALKILEGIGFLVDHVEQDTQYSSGMDGFYLAYTGDELNLVLNNTYLTEFFRKARKDDIEVISELVHESYRRNGDLFVKYDTDREIGVGLDARTPLLNEDKGFRYDSIVVGYSVSSLTPREELIQLVDNLAAIMAFWEYTCLYYSYGLRKQMGLIDDEPIVS